MDSDYGEFNICEAIWDDLSSNCGISFLVNVPSGLRFRYLSEIEKKSYSLLKNEINAPILRVVTSNNNSYVQIELVTENDNRPHFSMLYEVIKDRGPIFYNQKPYTINLGIPNTYDIKLENLGIRKMKQKEAIPRIKELYPELTEKEATQFYNKERDVVRLKATLFQYDLQAAETISVPIKSQIMKENTLIQIQHIAPKTIADINEQIIIVLQKKITSDDIKAFVILDGKQSDLIKCVYSDHQTFIFNAPTYKGKNPTTSQFVMRCGNHEDSKPITFLPLVVIEPRKRKIREDLPSDLPLKRSNMNENKNFSFDNAIKPLPESGIGYDIQTDNIHMETDNKEAVVQDNYFSEFDNESISDSGIHSGDRSSERNISDDGMTSSEDSDIDCIEIEGIKSKPKRSFRPVVINASPKVRSTDSLLDINSLNVANKKILSEVARIGHDFAFGQTASDLFKRMEQKLPVVFTLQDDVGDTPLNNAILKGNVEQAVKILNIVREHCNWALDLVNTSGHSALILAPACEVPASFIEQLLIAGCRIDLWDDTGKSAIIYAIEYQNTGALAILLSHVTNAVKHNMDGDRLIKVLSRFKDSYNSPLQIAVMNEFEEGVRMLLELKNSKNEYMVDVNEVGLLNEETALHIAVRRRSHINILKLLLSRPDIDINKLSNKTSALHIANQMKHSEISSLLKLSNAADLPCAEDENIEDSDDETDEENQDCENENKTVNGITVIETEMLFSESQKHITKVETLTSSMENMSLNGEQKKQIIDLLVKSPGPSLDVGNLKDIVKPSFRALFNKYNDSNDLSDIRDILNRFNCLPNTIGLLFENLDKIGRTDVKSKILHVYSELQQ